MENPNPYRPPATDISARPSGATDQTGPFSPRGRFGRLSYIAWTVILGIAGQLIAFAFGGTAVMMPSFDSAGAPVTPELGGLALAALVVVGLVSLVLGVIFAIRRCHDFNGSGWLVLLYIIPVVNLIFGLFLLFKPGSPTANNYGPPRVTPGWEKVVGIIGAVLIGLAFVGMIAAVALPFLIGVGSQPGM